MSDFAYTLDPVGNPTRIVRTGSLSETATYSYDASDRLTGVCYQETCPNGSDPYIRYTYDAVGNRLTESRPSGSTTYSYNNADELTQAAATAYTYDLNGNELSAGGQTFTYDLANRLASTINGGVTTTYYYDGDGNRTRATAGFSALEYVWDTNNTLPELTLERDGSGALLRRYLYGVNRISLSNGSDSHYYHYDRLGSVANVTSQAGLTEWTYDYGPFGSARSEVGSQGAPVNLMKFAGQMTDSNGYYYMRAREYDPEAGRFLTPDPLWSTLKESSPASYVYADDRPDALVDPSGLMPADVGGDGTSSGRPGAATTPAPATPPAPVSSPKMWQDVDILLLCDYSVDIHRVISKVVGADVTVTCPFIASIVFTRMCIDRSDPPYAGFPDSMCGLPVQFPPFFPYGFQRDGLYARSCTRGVERTRVRFDVTITAIIQDVTERFRQVSNARKVRC